MRSTFPLPSKAHDITALLNASSSNPRYNNSMFDSVPVKVERSWGKSADGAGIVLKFTITNTHTESLTLGGLGFPMPQAGMQHGIEESVWCLFCFALGFEFEFDFVS
jgi:hypothetical protein